MDSMKSKHKQLQVGDIVKSYDFIGVKDCYMVGEVIEVDLEEGFFNAKMIKVVTNGKSRKTKAKHFSAPLLGHFWMDNDFDHLRGNLTRIEVIA